MPYFNPRSLVGYLRYTLVLSGASLPADLENSRSFSENYTPFVLGRNCDPSMTKKKKSSSGAGAINEPPADKSVTPSTPNAASPTLNALQSATKSKSPDPSTSALIICRNKHWRCNCHPQIQESRTYVLCRHLELPRSLAAAAP